DRPRIAGGPLRRPRGAVRDRRGHQAPAAERPRRHRHDAPERGGDLQLRVRARAPRPGHHRAVSVRDWDAPVYERVSDPMFGWGLEVLDRLELRGDETVLDAGCGSARVTARLLDQLPRGHVVAVDASPSMVDQARAALDPERSTVFARSEER